MITIQCANCGKSKSVKPSEAKRYPRQFCNNTCRSAVVSQEKIKRVEVACAQCGKRLSIIPAFAKEYKNHFCNRVCSNEYRRQGKITVKCAKCGKEKSISPSLATRERYFCGIECMIATQRQEAILTRDDRRIKTQCIQCGNQIYRKPSHVYRNTSQFCSRTCRGQYQSEHPRGKHLIEMVCKQCGVAFKTWPTRIKSGRRFCSVACHNIHQTQLDLRVDLICKVCNKEYRRTFHQLTKRNSSYCSTACSHEGRRRNLHARNYYWRSIAEKIRQRDKHTCRLCGKYQRSPRLHVHHIIKASRFGVEGVKQANHPSNLVSLCASCHRKAETYPYLLQDVICR
jgi:5-methylcytosine-specific restriction endonuclease McrA